MGHCGQTLSGRRPSQMWNIIEQARSSPQVSEGINLDDLSKHYSNKFSASMSATPTIDEAEIDVCNKFNQLKDTSVFSDFVLSEHRIKNCIKRLKTDHPQVWMEYQQNT